MPDTGSSELAAEAQVVERFGYHQELKRGTGRFASFAVAFSFLSIATGIFTAYGPMLASSGPAGIWTWPIVVIGQTMVALVLGSLAARIPVTGYAYQWVSRLANPVLGWVMGWISFGFLIVVLVAVDYTIASTVLPVLLAYTGTAASTAAVTVFVLILQALLVGLSTKWMERVNGVAVSAELIGMVLLVVLLLAVGLVVRALNPGNLFSTAPVAADAGYLGFGDLVHVGPWMLGTLLGAFTIVGFETAANMAEETRDPARVVPRAMVQAVVSSGVLGFLFLVVVTMLAGDPATLAKSPTPIADVVTRVLGPVVGDLLLVLVVIAIFSCGMVIMLSGVRLTWAMSRDDRFPGHAVLKRVHPRTGTPLAATVVVLAVALVVLAVFGFQQNALYTLFSAAALLPALIYAATVLLYIVKRRSLPASRGFSLGGFELPVLAVASVWLVFELLIFRDASFAQPWLYVLVLAVVGAVYLAVLLARRGAAGLTMPGMDSIDAELDGSRRGR